MQRWVQKIWRVSPFLFKGSESRSCEIGKTHSQKLSVPRFRIKHEIETHDTMKKQYCGSSTSLVIICLIVCLSQGLSSMSLNILAHPKLFIAFRICLEAQTECLKYSIVPHVQGLARNIVTENYRSVILCSSTREITTNDIYINVNQIDNIIIPYKSPNKDNWLMSSSTITIRFNKKAIKKQVTETTFEEFMESLSRTFKKEIKSIKTVDQKKTITSLQQIKEASSNVLIAYENLQDNQLQNQEKIKSSNTTEANNFLNIVSSGSKKLEESPDQYYPIIKGKQQNLQPKKESTQDESTQESTGLPKINLEDKDKNYKSMKVNCDKCKEPIYDKQLLLMSIRDQGGNQKLCLNCGSKETKLYLLPAIRCKNFIQEIGDVNNINAYVIVTKNFVLSPERKQRILNQEQNNDQQFDLVSNTKVLNMQDKIQKLCIKQCNFDPEIHQKPIKKINKLVKQLKPQLRDADHSEDTIKKYVKIIKDEIEK